MHHGNSPIRRLTDGVNLQGFLFEPLPWRKKKKEEEKSLYLMFGERVQNGHSNIDDDNKY